jgi:CcmD family protein
VLVTVSVGVIATRGRTGARDGIHGRRGNHIVEAEFTVEQEFPMNAVKFLFAAYIATWVIHGVYLGTLVRRFSHLRRQLKELGKGK